MSDPEFPVLLDEDLPADFDVEALDADEEEPA